MIDVVSDVGSRQRGWKHSHSPRGVEKALLDVVTPSRNVNRPLTETQTTFISSPEEEKWEEVTSLAPESSDLQPGALIELRRHAVAVYAVVLGTAFYERRLFTLSMTSLGELIQHTDADTCFDIPNVIPRDLILRCGTATNPSQRTEIMARVEVVRRMREIENEVLKAYNTIGRQSRSLYPLVKATDPDAWGSVSTTQAVKLLATYRPDHYTTILAVHKHLMNRHLEFVVDFTSHRTTQTFAVRPQSHVDKLKRVTDMLHEDDVLLQDFIVKARGIIEMSRKRALESWGEPPTRVEVGGVNYTQDERNILDVLVLAFRRKRSMQGDPYHTVVSNIIKKLGLYHEAVDDSLLRQVLVELGEFAPWEDHASRRVELNLDPLPVLSTPTQPSDKTLGAEDFYPQDPVEHIRHDFGDMPVYVVDDIGAEELDDGLSVERIPSEPGSTWVHIHIADPTSLLPPTHALSEQARKIGTSGYFIHRTWPMLPHSLVYEKLSLGTVSKAGKSEPVLTFSFKISGKGDVTDWTVRAGLVRNVITVDYDSVDHMLGLVPIRPSRPFEPGNSAAKYAPHRTLDSHHQENLQLLDNISRSIRRNTTSQALNYIIPKASLSISQRPLYGAQPDDRKPICFRGFPDITYEVQTALNIEYGSRLMIAEYMKFAGRVASRWFTERGVPMLRRVQKAPIALVDSALHDLEASRDANGYVDQFVALKSDVFSPPVEYDLRADMHWNLGIPEGEGYVRVTSPLRRYSDLVAHWQIKHALLHPTSSRPLFTADWLTSYGRGLKQCEVNTSRAQKDHHKQWALMFIKRWMDDPNRNRGVPDPLNSLVARIISSGKVDRSSKEVRWTCRVPSLGLQCTLVDEGNPILPIGTAVDVKVQAIHLGTFPSIILRRK